MNEVLNFIEANKERYLSELFELLRIQSISSDPSKKDELKKCADLLMEKLKNLGFSNIKILNDTGHPIVYGERIFDKKKPTLLIYGHYDVQAVDPIEEWTNPPFEPYVKDNKIFARGATDDKGQLFTHLKSIEAYLNTYGELPLNVKIILEGEEEVGSVTLSQQLKKYKDLLKCNAVLVSDTSMFDEKTPSITVSLRGLAYFQIELTGPNRDLHSGTYGGAVHNPLEVLANLLSKMKDKNGKILIPGFYDDVIPLTKKDRESLAKLNFDEKKYMKDLGVKELFGEKGYTTIERASARPSFEINGIWGGFTGEGAKTVIPSKAYAKVSMRLVANQDCKKISKLFINYLKSIVPKTVKVDVKYLHGGNPASISIDNPVINAASRAMEKAFGKYPVFTREGGSIPIVVAFAQELNVPVVLLGFGLDDERAHSPNEFFRIENFYRGITCSAIFLDEMSKLKF